MSVSIVETFQNEHPIQMEADEVETIVQTIRTMPDDGLMLEWGSGASTIRWLQELRGRQRLISIEHNKAWYDRVRPVVDSDPEIARRLSYHLCVSNGYYDHGYGGLAEENPIGLDTYFYPDPGMYDADVILIDGVARGVCAQMVLARATKPHAVVFMHDWYRRALWYSWSIQFFKHHARVGTTLCRMTI